MKFASASRAFANLVTFTWPIAVALVYPCRAGELIVTVVDRSGRPVAEVAATVGSVRPTSALPASSGATAIMDQRDLAFVPQMLVVAVGTKVEFPNNDSVSHQVYSFSAAKKFQLSLYKGAPHPPVTFDKAGLVVVGCNIHDQMAGYIYVTDVPFFGKTDSRGVLHLAQIPAGDYRLTLWSPFISDPADTLTRIVQIGEHGAASTHVQLIRDQRSRPEPQPRRADWEY